jgi:hypothetical protein
LLESLVGRSLLWCAGSLNLTQAQYSKLRVVQHKMSSLMFPVVRGKTSSLSFTSVEGHFLVAVRLRPIVRDCNFGSD